MNLFIVASVYQLFNVLNLTEYNGGYKRTILVILQTKHHLEKKINIEYLRENFQNVIILNYKSFHNKFKKLMYFVGQILSPGVYGEQIKESFDNIFLSGTEMYSKIAAYKIKTESTNLFYYEDGVASYQSVLDDSTKRKNDLLLKLIWGHRPLEECRGLFVYEPDYVIGNSFGIDIYQIPKLEKRIFTQIDLKKVFYASPFSFEKRFVFLNTWFERPECYRFQEELVSLLLLHAGKKQCCVKTHPNELSPDRDHLEGFCYINSDSSFEISNYYHNFEENVFLSSISTACLTPKMIYNQEPVVIFLYKLFQSKFGLWQKEDATIDSLRRLYRDKSRFYVPQTIEEYVAILDHLKEQTVK